MTESQLIQALATAIHRLSQPGASSETIDLVLAELRSDAGIDCALTGEGVEVRWPGAARDEPRAAFGDAISGLVALAREAHSRAMDGVLDSDAFVHELQRCATAARWRDR